MNLNPSPAPAEAPSPPQRPWPITVLAVAMGLIALLVLAGGFYLGLFPAAAIPANLSGQLTVTATDSIRPLLDDLAIAFTRQNPNARIFVQPANAESTVAAVGDGAAELGGLARALTAEEQAHYPTLRLTSLAAEGLAVVTSPDVVLSTLSKADLQGIFTGQITNFKDVGGPDAPIVLITREAGSEGRAMFEQLALAPGQEISGQAFEAPSDEQLLEGISVIPAAIGYLPLRYVNESVATVPVDNLAATPENLAGNVYPLTANLNLISRQNANTLTRAFINFAFSPAGQTIIAGQYMPVARPVNAPEMLQTFLAAIFLALACFLLARGLWTRQNWARTGLIALLALGLIYLASTIIFPLAAQIFGGHELLSGKIILQLLGTALLKLAIFSAIPAGLIFTLIRLDEAFVETPGQRNFADKSVRYVLVASALSAILIVFLIIIFTMMEAWPAIARIGAGNMLVGTIWRPSDLSFGVLPMLVGSTLSTVGAILLGVPLSLGTAILLAEVAPAAVREIIHPAVELLAGIPSVVYGLFGMVVLAPVIRNVELPYNTGFGILNASIILAIMILPTVATITEDALRAVPRQYKEGSLALGATRWQTIWSVQLPAARSGIIAAIILGIGRALGETMALIMVIGNAIAMPAPLNGNPLSIVFSAARTLTGNIAVEINYASGVHKSSLFFTGVMLLVMILAVNMAARYLMKERLAQ